MSDDALRDPAGSRRELLHGYVLGLPAPGAKNSEATRVDLWLILRLARRPIWLVGLASQILGFAFQVTALHYGALALVQPVFALSCCSSSPR